MLLDIDECSTGDHNCTQNQWCVNSPGTFICECVSGYELLNGTCKGTAIKIKLSYLNNNNGLVSIGIF